MRTPCMFVFLFGSKTERIERANQVGRCLVRYASTHTKLQNRTLLVVSRSMIRYSLRRICFLSLQQTHLRTFLRLLAMSSPFAVCGEYTLGIKKQPRPKSRGCILCFFAIGFFFADKPRRINPPLVPDAVDGVIKVCGNFPKKHQDKSSARDEVEACKH